MKRYCFDNSGLSNPHETMPEDIPVYAPLWREIMAFIAKGEIATTAEIYGQMCKIRRDLGKCIQDNKGQILLEVGDVSWDFQAYINHFVRMQKAHHAHISEYSHSGSKRTIDLPDLSVIALAKCLELPVVSMEVTAHPSPDKRRIPDICAAEGVVHHTFNDFLRFEKIGT